ncbi:hypothetical protein [uncultured Nitratireductor sp.]|uniref:hypothetical protein n=1 Tax=uncultured Nitratireductor sp. TaxID=520953 RepID=UPI0025FBFD01|nr:hypothetical protein [uncultured Nitratireductor sp.]
MTELTLPYLDPKRPRFRRDPNFRPCCYESSVTVLRPEWLWSDEELHACGGLPRQEPGIFLSYRESGRCHTVVWCRPGQWHQWRDAAIFGDAPPSGGFDRSRMDCWSHRDFCFVQAAQFLRDDGHQIIFPGGGFSPVPRFSPRALEVWSSVQPLPRDRDEIFGPGFSPSLNPGGLH